MTKHDKNEIYDVERVIDYQISKVAYHSKISRDELKQIGYLGYLKAKKNYNPSFGQMSLTYATIYIRDELITAQQKENTYYSTKLELIEGVIPMDESTENASDSEIIKACQELLPKLDPIEQEIVYNYYLAEETERLVDIARKKCVSKQRIHQIKAKAIGKLQDYLREKGLI